VALGRALGVRAGAAAVAGGGAVAVGAAVGDGSAAIEKLQAVSRSARRGSASSERET
jgi:hypothetical protein